MFVWRQRIWVMFHVMYLVGGRHGNAYFRWFQPSKGNCEIVHSAHSIFEITPWRFQGWRWLPLKNCWLLPIDVHLLIQQEESYTIFDSASLPLFSAISGFWWSHKTLTPKGPGIIHWIKFQKKPSADWNLRQRLAAGCQGDGWRVGCRLVGFLAKNPGKSWYVTGERNLFPKEHVWHPAKDGSGRVYWYC